MKLDVNALSYLSEEDFRVLTAVEMGMRMRKRNHEIVRAEKIGRIAALKHGGTYKVLKNLLKFKLLHHDSSKYDGFRLTYLGYDFLAIKTLVNRGVFASVGRQIGVGKESDIFEVATEDGTVLAMKVHRLGRTSFRAVKSKRDYMRHRSNFSWLYLSSLAALKEFAFMKALDEHGFPVPHAVDRDRHCVIMSLINAYPLVQVKQLQNPDTVFERILGLVIRLAEHGLIHCDFNEFNIMIDDDESVTIIDFPQMVSVSHRNAQMYFDRDVECIFKFFRKGFKDDSEGHNKNEGWRPELSDITIVSGVLDKELEASGFTRKGREDIEKYIEMDAEKESDFDDEGSEDEDISNGDEIDEARLENFEALSFASKDGDNLAEDNSEKNRVINEENTSVKCSQTEHESLKADEDAQEELGHDSEEESSQIDENDPELEKRLGKQRRQAIKAAHGRKKGATSRNTYKDKGGKSSNNSKLQKQMSDW